ncbi:Uncharacterised protein [Serratia ficaria]|uniref:DUF5405 family protein n=1 Tax=Serratia TaxID=613 RepID=UPI000760ACFF|nr:MULTISPECIES: DUF5405 family protein [Serratia]MBJ2066970.1 DUF5405 family protein [Serratia odorifera]CAI1110149.1 Uncharacterised protein [Serratia ficaria]CAI1150090.1 Uncharacterised protein [Serratia ficaria]CAI1813091.1 Uncharacterised protein [Serratia ficaria]CAI2008672.1 Uncharacterised protein [Serratia ficaria]
MFEGKHIVVNNVFAINKFISGEFVLTDVRVDKDTNEIYYPTRAIYINEVKLIADLVNLSVKRAVYLGTISSVSEMMKESHRIAELGQQVLNKLNNKPEQ